jgi:hypothetical protein
MIIKSALASPLKLPAQAAALAALLATGVAGQDRLPTPEAAKTPPDARYELIISETLSLRERSHPFWW